MSFLLDTNIASAHIKRPSGLAHRFFQHAGQLCIPTIVLGELLTWAHNRSDPESLLRPIRDLLSDVDVLNFDQLCAEQFGPLRSWMSRQGITVDTADLIIASTALAHDLTLVTHNTADFDRIHGLRLEDWLAP